MPDLQLEYRDSDPDHAIASRVAIGLEQGDHIQVRATYFKVVRKYAVATQDIPKGGRIYRVVKPSHEAKPTRLQAVSGCQNCGKPAGLVGDVEPPDHLCPWCRKDGHPQTPGANHLWATEVMQQSAERYSAYAEPVEMQIKSLREAFNKLKQIPQGLEALKELWNELHQEPVSLEPAELTEADRTCQPDPAPQEAPPVILESPPIVLEPLPRTLSSNRPQVGQTWKSTDTRRMNQWQVVAVSDTHVTCSNGRQVALDRMNRYQLVREQQPSS